MIRSHRDISSTFDDSIMQPPGKLDARTGRRAARRAEEFMTHRRLQRGRVPPVENNHANQVLAMTAGTRVGARKHCLKAGRP